MQSFARSWLFLYSNFLLAIPGDPLASRIGVDLFTFHLCDMKISSFQNPDSINKLANSGVMRQIARAAARLRVKAENAIENQPELHK